jgi:hypothetical protein
MNQTPNPTINIMDEKLKPSESPAIKVVDLAPPADLQSVQRQPIDKNGVEK